MDGHLTAAYEPYLYLLDQLAPKAVYLMGGDYVTDQYPVCVEVLRARNVPVNYPEGGRAMGERFHFVRESTNAPAGSAVNSMEQRLIPVTNDLPRLTGDYLGQTPPGATPRVFARGIVSTDDLEHSAPAFTPDGNEVFWRENRQPGPDNKEWLFFTLIMRRENGVWLAPYRAPFGGDGMVLFSADGQRVYFSQSRSTIRDIWFAERKGNGWSEPKCLNFVSRWPELKSASVDSIARNGTLYFSGYAPGPFHDSGIYRAKLVNGEYTKPELLPRNINLSPFLNWTPFIAPDESYLLFASTRTGSLGWRSDLYISFQNADGSWTDPASLGAPINTDEQERLPAVSPDGKYLFFTRGQGANHDVFWVRAASIPALRSITTPSQEKPK